MSASAGNAHLKAAALGVGFGIIAMLVTDVIADAVWLVLPVSVLAAALITRARLAARGDTRPEPAPNRYRLRVWPWLRYPALWLAVLATIAFGVWQAWCMTCERLLSVLTEVQP